MTSAWGSSWASAWGNSWGTTAGTPTSAPTLPPLSGGKPDKYPGPPVHSALERSKRAAQSLADLRQAEIDRILAEEAALKAIPVPEPTQAPVRAVRQRDIVIPQPATVKLADIAPELELLKAKLEQAALEHDEDRRRRLLLLSIH